MFDVNSRAVPAHRYQPSWMIEPAQQFEPLVTRWLHVLSRSQLMGGPSGEMRRNLTQEFLACMYVYDLLLKQYRTELRGLDVPSIQKELPMMELNFAIGEVDARITKYQQLYRAQFSSDVVLGSTYANLQNFVSESVRAVKPAQLKRSLIRRKVRLVEYWLHGARNLDQPLIPNIDLQLQFLANAPSEQVELILDIMTTDAAKMMRLPDPTQKFSIETGSGFETSSSVEWTKEDFKRTVKAEASVSYGVRFEGKGEIEITGLKAKVEASAFMGARAEGSFEGSIGRDGLSVNAEVDAMIGIKLKFDAEVQVLDIFAIELGGEAFAGAMAHGKMEITATRTDGVKVALEGEAFAGLKAEGSASFEFKYKSLSMFKAKATGKVSLGVGVSGKLEFEVSPMGGTSFAIGGDVTVGVGMGGELEFEMNTDNMKLAASICMYKAYLYMLRDELEHHAYVEYFENMEINEARLKKAHEYLKKCETIAEQEYNAVANAHQRLAIFLALADSRWKQRQLPPIRPKGMDLTPVRTVPTGQGRARSNAIIGDHRRPVQRTTRPRA